MIAAALWAPLLAELDRWAEAGHSARFWLRDDDAIAPGPALETLLDLTACRVPLTLAVIPRDTGLALAERLAQAPQVSVAVHGYAHVNHAPPGQKKQELGPHRPMQTILTELVDGAAHLRALHPDRFVPLLVPPWNRIAPALVPLLPGAGFAALSVFGPEQPAPTPMVNTDVDPIDWRGTRGCRDPAAIVAEIVARLRRINPATPQAMGLLTHHQDHDAALWSFLEPLFDLTDTHAGCRWVRVNTLMPVRDASPAPHQNVRTCPSKPKKAPG